MKFLLDESADFRIVAHLVSLGHDVTSIVREHASSLTDGEVLAIAVREDCVLLTNDSDFGELVFRQGLEHRGIVVFRLRAESIITKLELLDTAIDRYGDRLSEFVVITDGTIRVRSTSDEGTTSA